MKWKNMDAPEIFAWIMIILLSLMLVVVIITGCDMALSPKELIGTKQGAVTDKIDESHLVPLKVGGTTIYQTKHNYYIIIDDVGRREIKESDFKSISEGDMITYNIYHVKGRLTKVEDEYIELVTE